LPVLVAEYNGTRYALVKNTPKDIPIKVYDYVKSSGHMMAGDLVPDVESYEKEIAELNDKLHSREPAEPPKALVKEVDVLRRSVEKLTQEKNTALKEAQVLAKEVKRLQEDKKDVRKTRKKK